MSIKVSLHDEAELHAALAKIRDSTDPTTFVVLHHHNDDPNTLALQTTGTDGFDGLKAVLTPDKVQYALLRLATQVDLSSTQKFVYVYNLGDKVPFVKKGRFGIVKGDATKHLTPYHVDLEITTPDELLYDDVVKKIQEAAGTADNIVEIGEGRQERGYTQNPGNVRKVVAAGFHDKSSENAQKVSEKVVVPRAYGAVAAAVHSNVASGAGASAAARPSSGPRGSGNSNVTFQAELLEALKDVRNDKSETKWVVGAYPNGNISLPVALLGSGTGTIDDMKKLLKEDTIAYGLYRVTDMIDNHPTIKFAYIGWVGSAVSAMKKVKIVSHKGEVISNFSPVHVEVVAYTADELTEEEVVSKVQASSGSKSFVK